MFNKTQDIVSDIQRSMIQLSYIYESDIKPLKEELENLENKKNLLLEKNILVDFSDVDTIILNVGGMKFQTSKSILTKVRGSYFDVMLSGLVNTQQMNGKSSTFFIDRDGTHFRYILNYLRDGENTIIPKKIKTEFQKELDFYNLSRFELMDVVQMKIIEEWIGSGRKFFRLLYKGTKDGFDSEKFHKKCDNKGATVSIIKTTDGSIFGGYNSESWNKKCDYFGNSESFIFTLQNKHNLSPTKYIHNGEKKKAYGVNTFGIVFGGGNDICLSNKCNENNNSYQNFPHSYIDSTGMGKTTLAPNRKFTVSEIEVFKLVVNKNN